MHTLLDAIAEQISPDFARFWWGLGSNGPRFVLYAEIFVAVCIWLWLMYRGYRWARGQKKVLGQWRTPQQLEVLVQYLYDEHRSGKVLPHAEMRLLRKYTQGTDEVISKQSNYY